MYLDKRITESFFGNSYHGFLLQWCNAVFDGSLILIHPYNDCNITSAI